MLIIGCDPGLTGAIALLQPDRGYLDVQDLPTCANGLATGSMKRWLDCAALGHQMIDWAARFDFARESIQVVIERPIPMPSLPAQTIASQFDSFGVLRAALSKWGEVRVVAPNEWKKLFGFGKDKDGARTTCRSLYPQAPVDRVKDHNRAEAILIGHWGMRQIHG